MARADQSEPIAKKPMKFLISGMQKAFQMAVKSLGGLVILMSFGGCVLWPVNKKNVIGTYQAVLEDGTPGLPDGGSEILELKPDGSCIQQIFLKDGRTFAAQATWTYDKSNKTVDVRGAYIVVIGPDEINPDIDKTLDTLALWPTGRDLAGRVILGSGEGVHYKKK